MTPVNGTPIGVLAQAHQALPQASFTVWAIFIAMVVALFTLDLLIMSRRHAEPSLRSSIFQTLFFVVVAATVGIALLVFTEFGTAGASQFFSGYVSEWLLSVDNLFVLALIMTYFGVPREYQPKVLFYGIFISIILRGVLIAVGISVVQRFAIIGVIMGMFLIYTAAKSAKDEDDEPDITDSRVYKVLTRYLPVTKRPFYGDRLIAKAHDSRGVVRWCLTVLGLVVMIIGGVDLTFAFDSIPVIWGITGSVFIAFSSNLLAVTGLRSVFFLFGHIGDKVSRLNQGVAVILGFIGLKMIIGNEQLMSWIHAGVSWVHPIEVNTVLSLLAILGILTLTVVASRLWPKTPEEVALDEGLIEAEVMAEIYVDASYTMNGEWDKGLIDRYLGECIAAAGRYDTDKLIPVHAFAEVIQSLGDFRVGEPFELIRPMLGRGCDLAAVLRHAREAAQKVTGKFIFIIMTDGRLASADDERAVRAEFAQLPDNAFVVFCRVSDEPGGAEFLDQLDEYNVAPGVDRCETVHLTDDSGAPKDQIGNEIGRELDAWMGVAV